jgi:hypothetical protein
MARSSHNSRRCRYSQALQCRYSVSVSNTTLGRSKLQHVQRTLERYFRSPVMLWLFMPWCGCIMLELTCRKRTGAWETRSSLAR